MTPGTLKEKSQTGTPGHKWRPGHREYKWRPGHRDKTTKGTPGGTGGYINDECDTGNGRLAITINKAQGQSLESWGIDLNTDCFPMDHYMLHVQESVSLTIYLYAQTMGQQRMLYIRKFYVVMARNMARNDLRVRGAWGGVYSVLRLCKAPSPTRCWGGTKLHPNS